MTLSCTPAVEFPLPDLATLFNRAFTGYIGGSVHFTSPALATMIVRENIDLNLSEIVTRSDEPLGLGFISRRGSSSRVAGMGIIPEAQGQGVGKFLLEHLIAQARARSEKTMALEVFEQNTRAVRLYQGLGFQVVRRLYGYTATELPGAASGDLREIDVYEAARMIVCYGADDLPWQVSGLAIARGCFPDRAYQFGKATAVISSPMRESIALKALIVPTEFQGHGHATRLLQALFAEFPGKEWVVPAICPEEYGVGFFEKRGFLRQELNQFQMSLSL